MRILQGMLEPSGMWERPRNQEDCEGRPSFGQDGRLNEVA